ncbi:MAG: hypothetical protein Q4G10_06630 [Bacteroidia bacterium]|nr:hypothetical protein [Bacteroidia bacterium]
MNWSSTRHLTIPEGNIIRIDRNGQRLWQGLPSGFTPIEYIAGNNSAYINTHLYLSDTDTVSGRFNLSGASNVFGCFTGSSASDNFSFYTGASNSSKLYARMDGKLDSSGYSVLNEDIDVFMDKTGFWINEVQKASFSGVGSFTTTAPLYIGWLANSSSPKIIGKIYEIDIPGKFYGIPARRDSDEVCGLYDFIGHTFRTSDSSVDFIGGEPV